MHPLRAPHLNFPPRKINEHAILSCCMDRSISIIGAGRVGTTLGKRLRQLGWRIGAVVTRSPATSRAAVRAIGAGLARAGITIDAASADVILLSTPDDALAIAARALAEISGADWRGKIVLHTSG